MFQLEILGREVATYVALEEAVWDIATLSPANKILFELILLSSDHQLRTGKNTTAP